MIKHKRLILFQPRSTVLRIISAGIRCHAEAAQNENMILKSRESVYFEFPSENSMNKYDAVA
jgi:hypothetical protein